MQKTTIACFSGTGNSWYASRRIADGFENAQVVLIPDWIEKKEEIEIPSILGMVFPSYFGGPPEMVVRFIDEVLATQDLTQLEYLFVVITHGGMPLYTQSCVDRLLSEAGCVASYSTSLKMPDGYILLYKVPTEETIADIYEKADEHLKEITQDVVEGKIKITKRIPFTRFYTRHIMERNLNRSGKKVAGNLVATDECTSCGICVAGCPDRSISLDTDGKPQFPAWCQACLGCYHRCPTHAISLKKKPRHDYTWYPNERSGFKPQYSQKQED